MLYKMGILKYLQGAQESTCAVLESLFYKAAGLQTRNFKKRLQDRCFLVNFEKFLRGPFLRNTFAKYVCWFYVTLLFCNYKKLSF